MARIDTREQLREWMLRQMGAPYIKVELTEDHLNDAIDKAIDRYAEFAYDGTLEGTMLVEIDPNILEYELDPSVIAVTNVMTSTIYTTAMKVPQGYVLDINPVVLAQIPKMQMFDIENMVSSMAAISNINALFNVDINYTYNRHTHTLKFFEHPSSHIAVIEIGMLYQAKEVDGIYNNQWIKKRAYGEAMLTWSNIVGKYSSNLINGSSINYSDIEEKGNKAIDETEDELFDITEPLGVYIF